MKFILDDPSLESWENRLLWKSKATDLWRVMEEKMTFVTDFISYDALVFIFNVPTYEQEMPRVLWKQRSLLCPE
jgi:hypothetical protein